MTQCYELTYVLPGSLELESVPAQKALVAKLLQEAGAQLTSELDLERRRLAYPIGPESYGYYHLQQFDIAPAALKALDAKLRLENQLLRFILVKTKPLTVEALASLVAGEKYKKQRPPVPVSVPVVKLEQTSATALTEAEMEFAKTAASKHVAEVEEVEKKVSIEELDKKLDAILEDTDLDKKL